MLQVARLEGNHVGSLELLVLLDGYQPETVDCVVEEAVALAAVALNERYGTEVFQTGTGRGHVLATTTTADSSVLEITKKSKRKLVVVSFHHSPPILTIIKL